MNNRKFRYRIATLLSVLALLTAGCSDDTTENTAQRDRLVTDLLVPGSTFYTSTTKELTIQGKGFAEGDALALADVATGAEIPLTLKAIDHAYVTFAVPQEIPTGSYRLVVHRGRESQVLGILKFRRSLDIEIPDKEGMNVKGVVFCGSLPVAGVVVSDGEVVTTTDDAGCYYLASKKHHGYVFMSVPSGYEPQSENSVPLIWGPVTPGEEACEQVDFELVEAPGQDDFDLLVLADIHLANRLGDIAQYKELMLPEVKNYIAASPRKVYIMNVGDMTFDLYWNSNKYNLGDYTNTLKDSAIPALIYHVPGNHDNDEYANDDYTAEQPYKDNLGPTYYSFNIGKVHYVVLDDMLYHGRNKYDRIIAPEQLAWLYKDLRALDPEIRQLVVACHVPLVANNGAWDDIWYNLKNKDELFVLLQDYDVTIMTGDWHTEGTTRVSDRIVEYVHPAVTGNWWYRQGICCNGYPAAFTEYVFRGDRLESRSLIDWANGNSKQQYRVYNKGVTSNTGIASSSALDPAGGAPSVLVFFWGVAPNWTFVCRENGELTYGRGQLVQRYDPLARSLVEEGIIPYERYTWLKQKPVRLYLYTPKDPGAEIEIVGTDHIRNRDFRVVTRIER